MVVKYPVNGLLNVMIADLLISIPALQRLWGVGVPDAVERKPLRAYLIARLSAGGHGASAGAEHRERRELCRAPGEAKRGNGCRRQPRAIREDLEDHTRPHQLAVRELSRSITAQGRFDLDSLNGWLQQTRQVYTGFQSITIGNADGFPIAVDPQEVPGLGTVLSNKPGDVVPDSATMRDREYFQRTMALRQSVISDVFVSRVVRQPTVAVTAPIFMPGWRVVWRYRGNAGFVGFRAI